MSEELHKKNAATSSSSIPRRDFLRSIGFGSLGIAGGALALVLPLPERRVRLVRPAESIPVEKAVLSCLLTAPALLNETDELSMLDFTYPHMVIFGSLLEMHFRDMPIDLIELTRFLRDKGQLEVCGGTPYITRIFTFLSTAANYRYYAKTLRKLNRVLWNKVA